MELTEGQNINVDSEISDKHEINLINLSFVLSQLSKNQREKLMTGYQMSGLERVFKDVGMMNTIDVFFKNGMNVSRTARILYMHRNTLMYKLGTIKRLTGLDLKDFNMAVTFKILHTLYALK